MDFLSIYEAIFLFYFSSYVCRFDSSSSLKRTDLIEITQLLFFFISGS